MGPTTLKGMRQRRSTLIVALIATILLVIVVHDVWRAGFATDRLKRILELEGREAQLHEQLAQKDAQRESQRAIYVGRIRNVEAQLRDRAFEIGVLRASARSDVSSAIMGLPPTSRD